MIYSKLLGHQRQAVDFLLNNGREYGGIFLPYGSGKSLVALSLIEAKGFQKVLIVGTKLGVFTEFPNEIRKHSSFKYYMLNGTKEQKIASLKKGQFSRTPLSQYQMVKNKSCPTLFLINFDGVIGVIHELDQYGFDAIFIDESRKIKYSKTMRTKTCIALARGIGNRYIMTGFPWSEGVQDIYSQIKCLDGGEALGKSYYGFIKKYFSCVKRKMFLRRGSKHSIINKLKPFCVFIDDVDVVYPKSKRKVIYVPATEEQKKIFYSLHNEFSVKFNELEQDFMYVFTLISRELQVCDGFLYGDDGVKTQFLPTNKEAALLDLLLKIESDNKIIIWVSFIQTAHKLKMILERAGFNVLVLVGGTENPNMVISSFRKNSKYNILITIYKKSSDSLNLQEANICVFYSHTWSFDNRSNAEGRIRRKGSIDLHKNVYYIDFLTEESVVENKVFESGVKKKQLIDELQKEFVG